MTVLRALVVDDEPLARRRLEQHLERMGEVTCVGAASGCREGAALIAECRPDVVLLDIRMRDGTGFDLIDRFEPDQLPEIIFVTAFEHHAVKAFEASATDFLVKPVEFQRLRDALTRTGRRIRQREMASHAEEMAELVANLREQIAENTTHDRFETEFWVRQGAAGFIRVAVADIRWIGSEDDYVRLVTANGSHLMRGTLREIDERLDPRQFARIHRSTLVRLSDVQRFVTRSGNMDAVMSCGAHLRVGRPQARQIRALLGRPGRSNEDWPGHALKGIGKLRP